MQNIHNILQQALEYDQEGNWKAAHDLVDGLAGKEAAHIHAYLHRKEGDDWNARYWYNKAGEPFFDGSLGEEWKQLQAKYSG
jgi:hypothetical protein